MLTSFDCGRLLQPLSNENHMMDHIQLWKIAKNLHPEKNINKQSYKNREDSEAKLTGDLVPAVL